MNKELSGKGYIQGGEGFLITSTGERHEYHDGELTQVSVGPWPNQTNQSAPTTCADDDEPQGVIEMKYLGASELRPLYDSRQSFYGKAFVERYAAGGGTRLVLRSYGTIVAVVMPTGVTDADTEAYRVEIGMRYLSATTLRHVKEFLAQTDDVFKGITLPWLRKAIKDGREIEGAGPAWRKVYVLNEL